MGNRGCIFLTWKIDKNHPAYQYGRHHPIDKYHVFVMVIQNNLKQKIVHTVIEYNVEFTNI